MLRITPASSAEAQWDQESPHRSSTRPGDGFRRRRISASLVSLEAEPIDGSVHGGFRNALAAAPGGGSMLGDLGPPKPVRAFRGDPYRVRKGGSLAPGSPPSPSQIDSAECIGETARCLRADCCR